MKKTITIETILVIITGVLLTLVRYSEGGINSINKMAEGVETNPMVIYMLFALLGLAIISRLLRKFYGINTYNYNAKMQFVEEVCEGVGSGLLGIYRLISGMAITVPFIWYFTDRDAFLWQKGLGILLIGIMFFVGLLILSWANNKSKGD
ncbi:hypothetical protein N473_07485 [Pseudoalteromonas luteoviolacea CPMOR-1]|uniref:Uncharacterized protein n=1 Tax=Pseudoalteromonas luteoviolacea CPMOR-1 TaxID=1365248 RepID=A0A167NH29_9GAMM|nr:hypothetical protein [Pseudoalteromonas luteoviolacea]KZN68259.1 hypothetical protein N473_07485 [Pseudoalteromonas luteoviolacea CPMOR-1]